jgi:3-hydroxyisobutyrate dehydrogenase-like beta-hydroxyacid dehydrogenase
MSRNIGFIGLGVMGASMARRLLQAGHQVTVYNRTAARCEPLVAAGARAAATPADAAAGQEIVISIVTDSPDVEAVLLGPGGAAERAARGTIFVDMSTISPEGARRVGRTLAERGLLFLDAPVTGGDIGAREGTLSILVGGDPAVLDRVRDVLEAMGKRITHCGPVGAGQTLKACNQILCALNMVGITEALHLARVGGIDQKFILEALTAGAGGSWALEKLGPRIVGGDFAPGFMVKLIQKDLRIVQELAQARGLKLEGTALAQRAFADNEAHGEGDLGTQAMYKVLERRTKG